MVFPSTTEVYCWPSAGPDLASHAVPAWVKQAIRNREVRISDGDAYLEGVRIHPGDYLLRVAGGTLLVATPEVYAALTGETVSAPPSVEKMSSWDLPDGLTTEGPPDRETTANPYNAAVEGADIDAPIPAPQPHL